MHFPVRDRKILESKSFSIGLYFNSDRLSWTMTKINVLPAAGNPEFKVFGNNIVRGDWKIKA